MIAATEKVTKCEETQIGGNTQMSEEAAIPAIGTSQGPAERKKTHQQEVGEKMKRLKCCSLRVNKEQKKPKNFYNTLRFEFQLTTLPLLN